MAPRFRLLRKGTMVKNRKKNREFINSHSIIHCSMSGASEQGNGRASAQHLRLGSWWNWPTVKGFYPLGERPGRLAVMPGQTSANTPIMTTTLRNKILFLSASYLILRPPFSSKPVKATSFLRVAHSNTENNRVRHTAITTDFFLLFFSVRVNDIWSSMLCPLYFFGISSFLVELNTHFSPKVCYCK